MTAILEPSGDQLGNPNAPPAESASGRDDPSVSTIDSELSAARSAIDPLDAIGWSIETEAPAAALGDGPAAEGVTDADAEGAAVVDGEGVGPPQAATRMTRTTHHAIAPFDLIGQRYVADVRADAHRPSPA